MKCLVITLLLGFFTVETLAMWHRSNYPNPQDTSKDECSREGKKSWICDPNQVLTFDEANKLEYAISKLANMTVCACSDHICKRDRYGYHVAIAIAPKVISDEEKERYDADIPDYTKEYTPLERLHHTRLFAYTMLKQWKLGKCDDGILMVYDPENFSFYTVGGEVALRKLTPHKISEITGLNRLKFGDSAFVGLQKMLDDYRDVLLNRYDTPKYGHRPETAAVIGKTNSAPQPTRSIVSLLLLPLLAAIL